MRIAEEGHLGTDSGARAGASAPILRALGAVGLLGVVASVALLCAGAAGSPTQYVPAREGGWPGWLAGPFAGLHLGLSSGSFQALMLVMCGSYVLVLVTARVLAMRLLAAAILLAHLFLLLGPPLISQDVFGYLAFARMGALHGLDPYTHVAAQAPADAVFRFVGWPFLHSPYGPLFTLASYLAVPLGVAGGLWFFKALTVICSLGAIALIVRASARSVTPPAGLPLRRAQPRAARAGGRRGPQRHAAAALPRRGAVSHGGRQPAHAGGRGRARGRRRGEGDGGIGAAVPDPRPATPARTDRRGRERRPACSRSPSSA